VWAFGQAAPAFEVASVRMNTTGANEGLGRGQEDIQHSPDGLTMRNVRLRSCLKWAYGLADNQVSGPDWINTERYDIAAKAASPVAEEQLRLMLRTLLAERFHLAFHKQTKELSTYTLHVARNGPKFKESAGEGESVTQGNQMNLMLQKTTMEQFAKMLATPLGGAVVDMTGLKGKYDFSLDLMPYLPDKCRYAPCGLAEIDITNSIASALLDQLGLQLAQKKEAVEVYVVDHADRTPLEN
jgi:uncharacterized protein (TIGR03435 family)